MDWNRISGLWLQFQEIAKANWNEPATAQDKLAPVMRQPTRHAAGIHDPLVRQIDYYQRMALMKREIEEVEREVVRFRAICEETRETLRRGPECTAITAAPSMSAAPSASQIPKRTLSSRAPAQPHDTNA